MATIVCKVCGTPRTISPYNSAKTHVGLCRVHKGMALRQKKLQRIAISLASVTISLREERRRKYRITSLCA